jgi:hypothetical protein
MVKVSFGSIASVWLSVDDFRFSPKADTVTDGRHVSKVPAGDILGSSKIEIDD